MDADTSGGVAQADDSGLFSCSSDADDTANHSMPRQQDKKKEWQYDTENETRESLFLMSQELRKSRSEIERLSKSEQWYKQELQTQKHNRLETLERLYVQERKYMLENQRLQQESQRLQSKCEALESREQSATGLTTLLAPTSAQQSSVEDSLDSFEAKQQHARLMDQRQLTEVLRKQKKQLLADMERLSLEHDSKQLQLQRQLAGVELENKHMTRQCKQLIDERRELAHKLELKASTLRSVTAEREQLRQVVAELNETLQTQEHLLALKEREFLDMKQHYEQKLNSECTIDAMHNYSMAFHGAIIAKTSEITSLKHSVLELQSELLLMSKLQAQNEEQQHQIEQLNFQLEAQLLEDTIKDAQLKDLAADKSMITSQLKKSEQALQSLEQQLMEVKMECAEKSVNCELIKRELEEQQSQNNELAEQLNRLREQMLTYERQCHKLSDEKCQMEQELKQSQQKQIVNASTQTMGVEPMLEQRIESLEQQLSVVSKQKEKTVALLQQLLQQQNNKIRNTAEMEADWRQLLEALQATQQMEQKMELLLQQKSDELQQLNELFGQQNEQLQQLQLLSRAHEIQNAKEIEELKQAQTADAASLKQMQTQVQTLLKERDAEYSKQFCNLLQMLEFETSSKMLNIKNWPELIAQLRQELRTAKAAAELPVLKTKLTKVGGKYEQALARIKFLEQTLAEERARVQASDSIKSLDSSTPLEPAHEVANLIDDYKKLIHQTAQETGRPRNSYILELIERSQRSQPNLCQLSEGLAACRENMRDLTKLLASLESGSAAMPSLMEELRAVAEKA